MTDHEALSAAIFALNTLQEPQASDPNDWAWVDDNTEEIIDCLREMRSRV